MNQKVFGIVSNHFNKSILKLSLCFRTNCRTQCLEPRERSKQILRNLHNEKLHFVQVWGMRMGLPRGQQSRNLCTPAPSADGNRAISEILWFL
jgi:hypothetical protein